MNFMKFKGAKPTLVERRNVLGHTFSQIKMRQRKLVKSFFASMLFQSFENVIEIPVLSRIKTICIELMNNEQ